MSDTQKLILWIVIAVIVIAIVAWFLVSSSRRRREEERRRQAGSLRAQAKAQQAGVTRAADKASVTRQLAAEARTDAAESRARAGRAMEEARAQAAEAERKAAEAQRVDELARSSESEAYRVQASHDDLLREADRVDPDVETPDEPDHPTDAVKKSDAEKPADEERPNAGARAAGTAGTAGAAGAMAAAGIRAGSFDDDEPDLADAENPFSSTDETGSYPQTPDSHETQGGSAAEAVSAPTTTPDEARPDDIPGAVPDDVERDADKGAGDTRGTRPTALTQAGAGPSAFATGDADADSAHRERPSTDEDDGDWVNGPVDEEAIDDRPTDDVVDWINGPSDDESVTVEVPDHGSTGGTDPVAAATVGGAQGASPATSAPAGEIVESLPEEAHFTTPEQDEALQGDQKQREERANINSAGSDESNDDQTVAIDEEDGHGESQPAGDPDADADAPEGSGSAPSKRRISGFEEVRDGGYGVGSAAPIEDGAQPLGHAVKAVRDGSTYLTPGSEGYDDVEPDVWFLDERAARKAGYKPTQAGD